MPAQYIPEIEAVKVLDPDGNSVVPAREDSLTLLRRIMHLLKPLSQITGGGSSRLSVDINNVTGSVATVTTVTAVTTVNNLAAIGSISAFDMVRSNNRAAYATGIRANIL